MAFVPVRVSAPNGKSYRVDIDDEADVDAVKRNLVEGIGLDPSKRYILEMVDALVLRPNVALNLREVEPPSPIRRLEVEDADGG